MTEEQFRSEMRRVDTMRTLDPDRADYFAGYMRGLRRAYHGEKFGTAEEHTLWLSLADDTDISRQSRGLGYRDGLKAGGEA